MVDDIIQSPRIFGVVVLHDAVLIAAGIFDQFLSDKKKDRPCNGLSERKRKERESMEIFIQVLSRSLLGCFFFLFCCVSVLSGTIRRQGVVTRYRRLVSGDDRTADMLSGKPLLFLCWDSEYPV